MDFDEFKLSVDVVVVGRVSRLAKVEARRGHERGREIKVEGKWMPARLARYVGPCNNAW